MFSRWYHRVVAFQKSDSSSEAFESDSSESERRAQIEIEVGSKKGNNKKRNYGYKYGKTGIHYYGVH